MAAVALAALLVAAAVSGCSVIRKVNNAVNTIETNKQIMDSFTSSMNSSKDIAFTATYVTTGSSPATVVYGVNPPHEVAFTDTPAGGGSGGFSFISNASGEYSCTNGVDSTTCDKLSGAQAISQQSIVDFYTPAHWVSFLDGFSLAAGFAGDKVNKSTASINGFSLNCVDFQAPGVSGTSRICTTKEGILGLVNVAGSTTAFELKSYSTHPPASMFQLNPRATVVTPSPGSTTSVPG